MYTSHFDFYDKTITRVSCKLSGPTVTLWKNSLLLRYFSIISSVITPDPPDDLCSDVKSQNDKRIIPRNL